jgi:hypothetical protein
VRQFLAKKELLRRKRLRAALLAQKVRHHQLHFILYLDIFLIFQNKIFHECTDIPDAAREERVQEDPCRRAHLPEGVPRRDDREGAPGTEEGRSVGHPGIFLRYLIYIY